MTTVWAGARKHWWSAVVAALAAAVVALMVFMLAKLGAASDELDGLRTQQVQQSRIVTDLSSNLADAQSQLKRHGITPAQPPPAQIIAQAGPPGAMGATGPEGKEGPAGPSGPSGAAGSAGAPGAPGPTGPTGPAGPSGAIGASGAQGSPGPTGPVGASGASGEQGSQGPSGAIGPVGPPGPSGEQGPQGPAGSPGPECPSGYQPTQETINGHQAMVCEQPTPTSPSSTPSTGAAPAAKRHSDARAAGAPTRSTSGLPVLMLSAILIWPPERRALAL